MSLFFPAPQPVPSRPLREASVVDSGLSFGADSDDYLYRRAGGAPRDLLGVSLRRAQDLSVALYRANPLAHRMIGIYRSYLAGNGFDLAAHNPDVRAVVDDFWGGSRNRLDQHNPDFARDWLLMGEGFHPTKADEAGNLTVGYIDPSTVESVARLPGNNLILTEVHVRTPGGDPEKLRVAAIDTDPASDGAGLWQGDVTAWLFDRIAASSRGNPFLLPSLDWLDAYDQMLWEMVERTKAMRAFFWQVVVQGGKTEVEEAKEIWGTTAPRSGSVRFITDASKVEAVAPQLGTYEDVAGARYVRQHLAVGAGLAPHWLGSPEDANRSTAEQMDIPVLRSLQDTQAEWRGHIVELVEMAVDAKVRAGYLDRLLPRHVDERGTVDARGGPEPARNLFTVTVPEIRDAQVQTAAAALAQAATAFGALDLLGPVVGPQMVRAVIRQMLPALGIPAEDLPDEEDDTGTQVQAIESYRRRYSSPQDQEYAEIMSYLRRRLGD